MKPKTAALAAGVGLLTASVILLELLLTRLFSVILYYHFAFLAVSVAMLGLGGGGLVVYLNRERVAPAALGNLLHTLVTSLALLMVGVLVAVLHVRVPAELGGRTAGLLLLLFGGVTLPFFCAGATSALLVWKFAERIHRIYAYDLTGAACGSLAVLPLLGWLGAPGAVVLAALLAAVSAGLLGWATGAARSRLRLSAALAAALGGVLLTNLPGGLLDVHYAKGVSVRDELYARWNALSRVCVHPGRGVYWIRIDCDAATEVPAIDFGRVDRRQVAEQFSRVSEDLAHVLRPGARTLVIGSGGGRDVARALAHASPRVVAVEINPLIARDLMLGFLREDSRRLFERPEVELVVDDARSAIQRSAETFDVMQSTLIDTWASTVAGAFALTESYLYTREAFAQYLGHLAPDGILIVTRWEFVPPRQALRVVAVGRAALEQTGAREAARHVVVVQDGGGEVSKVSVLLKRTPFTAAEIEKVDAFLAARAGVRALYVPGRSAENAFFELLHARDPAAYAAAYPFDVSATTDARPFFFFTTRWSRLAGLFRASREDLKNNLALFVLAVLLLLSLASVAVLLLLPRWLSPTHVAAPGFTRRWFYFLCIGMGYIVVEIALIQTFILFLGHPTYGITIVVFALLVGSGLGSAWSGRLGAPGRTIVPLTAALGLLLALLHLLGLPPMLALAQGFSREARGLISVVLLLPLGFLMGIPFPSGVRAAGAAAASAQPWFWSANAAGSVLGSTLAIVVAITAGIPTAGALGGVCYLLAGAAALAAWRSAQAVEGKQI